MWNIYTSLQCKNFSSETFLGVVNVNATNVLGKSQYFVDRSECIDVILMEFIKIDCNPRPRLFTPHPKPVYVPNTKALAQIDFEILANKVSMKKCQKLQRAVTPLKF